MVIQIPLFRNGMLQLTNKETILRTRNPVTFMFIFANFMYSYYFTLICCN